VQPVLQDRVAVSLVGALAAVDVVRDLRPVLDRVAQGFEPAERGLFGVRLGEPGGHALFGPGQGYALSHDRLPPRIVDVVPIDEINPVGQVAIAECLGQPCGLIECQWPSGVDSQIEIGITPGQACRP